jgi:inosine/xanthosine triphosphatase
MQVGLGSRNPVKVSATERALPDATVDPLSVDSGVSEQPTGHAETVQGAVIRAERALAAGEYDLGVGIEGGVAHLDAAEGLWLVMWAAATDGDRTGRGAGPSLRLPDAIARRVEAGEELGPVMDDVLGEDDVAQRQGAAGALSGGVIDRESALRHALGGALGPFLTDHY